MDAYGLRHAACPSSGRIKARATPIEWCCARVCREAGARVITNAKLRDLNVDVSAEDGRHIEVVASGLPCYGGAQLAVDATLGHPRNREGEPRPRADRRDGAAADAARADKEATYPDLASGHRCRLVVVAVETGGRFSTETCDFIRNLAWARARAAPSYLRASTVKAFESRLSKILALAVANAFSASLLLHKDALACESIVDGKAPWLPDLLSSERSVIAGGQQDAEDSLRIDAS